MLSLLRRKISDWLVYEAPIEGLNPLCDFERLRFELRPGDVILAAGRSRVAKVISQITQSAWTHSVIYIGRIYDIDDLKLREVVKEHFKGDPDTQLIIEGMLGQGTIVVPLENYKKEHLRICRPRGLSRQDAQEVIRYVVNDLGKDYDLRQIFDLARFLFPWTILPRRWRSSLFEAGAGDSTKLVCSTMIANAFQRVNFPIVPIVNTVGEKLSFKKQNTRLITPRDFDYSPYFEIIKYPITSHVLQGYYRDLPWEDKVEAHDEPAKVTGDIDAEIGFSSPEENQPEESQRKEDKQESNKASSQ